MFFLQTEVIWTPHYEWEIRKVYESKARKRLCDILVKLG